MRLIYSTMHSNIILVIIVGYILFLKTHKNKKIYILLITKINRKHFFHIIHFKTIIGALCIKNILEYFVFIGPHKSFYFVLTSLILCRARSKSNLTLASCKSHSCAPITLIIDCKPLSAASGDKTKLISGDCIRLTFREL